MGHWHGDALDVDAHLAKLTRIDLLRRKGYLDSPRAESKGAAEHARNRDKLPRILVNPDVAHVVDQAEAVLMKSCRTLVYERGGVLVRVDALLPEGDAWRIVEVKASTSVKDEHVFDCAAQRWVFGGLGHELTGISLAHVDNTFVYEGDGDFDGLLTEADCRHG